jgi:hypothetical protein
LAADRKIAPDHVARKAWVHEDVPTVVQPSHVVCAQIAVHNPYGMKSSESSGDVASHG